MFELLANVAKVALVNVAAALIVAVVRREVRKLSRPLDNSRP